MSRFASKRITRRQLMQAAGAGSLGLPVAIAPAEAAPATPPASPGDWPMYRHDPALTAISPLKGGLGKRPEIAWSVDLGGPAVPSERILVADLTGEGREGFLTLGASEVTGHDARGRQLWKLEGYAQPNVLQIADFAGDGSRGILLTTTTGGRVDTFMVSGRTGAVAPLWRDENNFGGHLRVGQLLPHTAGLQIASTSSGSTPPDPWGGNVRLVSFAGNLSRPRFHLKRFVEGGLYSPLILFADLDSDGQAEMVIISHEEIWTLDPETGRQKFNARYGPSIRTYMGTVAAVHVAPGAEHPSLVMINPSIPGLRAVRTDGRSFAETSWKVVVGPLEDQYQPNVAITPAGSEFAFDLAGDGHYQLAAAVFNEHGNGKTRLVIFDAVTGKRLGEAPDARILAVEDLDADGRPEVLLQSGTTLRIARWSGSELSEIWSGSAVEPLLRPVQEDLARTIGGSRQVWRETPGASGFLLRFTDGLRSCRLKDGSVERGAPIAVHEALGNLPERSPEHDRVSSDGRRVVTTAGGKEVYHYEPLAPQTYLARPPLVADLAGRRQIIVRDSSGTYQSYSAGGGRLRALVEQPYEQLLTHVDVAGAAPTICDLDGDGENEVLTTLSDKSGLPYCAILAADGTLKRRIDPIEGATIINRGPTGRLGSGQGRWLLLRMSFGNGLKPGRRPIVAAYDGKTGKQLWVRDSYGSYGDRPVMFVPHFPTAVVDYDGDGVDDWLVCSENFYGVIDVRRNRDLAGPVTLSDAIPGHWTAYSYPSVGDLMGDGRLMALHHQAYSLVLLTDLAGKPHWHFGMSRDTAGTWGMMADFDGDRKLEVLHVQQDGVIRCFAPKPMPERCPRCPKDAALTPANHGARQRWTLDMKGPISRMAAADLDGDGRIEVLFGDGTSLHALGERGGKAKLLWSIPFGRKVGEPVVADVDRDGRPEILVPVEDGRLYCLRSRS